MMKKIIFILFPLYPFLRIALFIRSLLIKYYPAKRIASQKIIGIGNLTLGGTGKTPVEEKYCSQFDQQVNIITRGYKRKLSYDIQGYGWEILQNYKAKEIGDEAFWFAQKCPQSFFVITNNKENAILNKSLPFPTTIIDDAFHKFKIKQDVRICVIDATQPFGNFFLFPFGTMRHPISDLKFADRIIITKTNCMNKDKIKQLKFYLKRKNHQAEIFFSVYELENLININGETVKKEMIENKNIFAFCGIGNPNPFFNEIKKIDPKILIPKIYSDHHQYQEKDLKLIQNNCKDYDLLITTEKDLTKLYSLSHINNLYATKMKIKIFKEERELI